MDLIFKYAAALILMGAVGASAEPDFEKFKTIMYSAKMAGMCGNIQQMMEFQESTNMAGGDEFIARFVKTEAARLGYTNEQLIASCEYAATTYKTLLQTADIKSNAIPE